MLCVHERRETTHLAVHGGGAALARDTARAEPVRSALRQRVQRRGAVLDSAQHVGLEPPRELGTQRQRCDAVSDSSMPKHPWHATECGSVCLALWSSTQCRADGEHSGSALPTPLLTRSSSLGPPNAKRT